MEINRYKFSNKISKKIAVLADSHGTIDDEVLKSLIEEKPDYIVSPGDFFDRHPLADNRYDDYLKEILKSINKVSSISPFYMSLGNHERYLKKEDISRITNAGATLLDNSYVELNDIAFGGFSSNVDCGVSFKKREKLQLDFLDKFEKINKYKILLSHHPEYYKKYIKDKDINLVISGHAHGGQIRILGLGIFAPGQGFFPRLTSGRHDKMIISRGLKNTAPFPRYFNPCELIYINI